MAGQDDGDNFFDDDDDLDTLPHDALVELENNAIQFTQAQTATRYHAAASSDYGDDFDDEELDDAVVIDESRSTPAAISALHRNIPGQGTPREQFRQQRHGTLSTLNPNLASRQRPPDPPKFNQPNRSQPRIPQNDSMTAQQGSQASGLEANVESLQRQIEELIRERNNLKVDLSAKIGEIAIVRSKQEKTAKEYEREMIALRKLNEDKLAKQQKALEAARIAEKNAAIERDFIKQDLAEESERVRRLNKAKEVEKKDGLGVTTPKKKKALPHRDGFDDDEIEILSPSKISPSKFQKKTTGSPSKPGKRKRKTADSPAGALEVVASDEPPTTEPEQKAAVLDEAIIARLGNQDDRFDFIGAMLDHRYKSDQPRTVEELSKYALPSAPRESFQSIVLGKIPVLGFNKSAKDLPIDFCELLISMWAKCVEEKYYTPTRLFIDMLSLALEMKTTLIAPYIIDTLVPLAQLTVDSVGITRFKNRPPEPFEKDVDVTACMGILYLAALGCMSEQEHITRFWKLMRWDFVLYMLSANQNEADSELLIRLLSTSVMKESFGAIPGDGSEDVQTGYILDRLTMALNEVPTLPRCLDKMPAGALAKLRLRILHLLTSMTRSPFASRAIAMNAHTIGRLVYLISDELDVLYDFKDSHEESAQIITLAMRLLYHLVTKYDSIIDMQKKLSVIHGGSQKYLLCLSRLNFSEDDLVLESGIDLDVAGYALEMLELVVTPEEGDSIEMAFSSSSRPQQ